jgi:hypothetical protein
VTSSLFVSTRAAIAASTPSSSVVPHETTRGGAWHGVRDAFSHAGMASVRGIGWAAAAITGPLREALFVPLNKTPEAPRYTPSRDQVLRTLAARNQTIVTQDGVRLDAVWAPPVAADGPVVVIFHGNGCVANSMLEHGAWYRRRGFGVLLVTMRGYPGSTGDARQGTEPGAYRDAAAALNFVLQHTATPPGSIIAHGYSYGGVHAVAAGRLFGVPVVLDHAFTRPLAVMRYARGTQASFVPAFVLPAFAWGMFQKGATVDVDVYDRSTGSFRTAHLACDGLDNAAKLHGLESALFIIYGANDQLMDPAFANELYACKHGPCPSEPGARRAYLARRACCIGRLEGAHSEVFADVPAVADAFAAFLRRERIVQ